MKIPLKIPIILRVKIIGPKDFREVDMILDTGARYTVISWDIAKDIGYDPAISQKRTSIVTANGVIETPLLKIKNMSISEVKIDNVKVICLDIPELVGVEGLLGLSFLDKIKTVIDYKKGFLEMEK